ncbi:DNA repair protein RecN [Gleimia hominis]|uniref:DNA repair protein RecN n=1 Tax=Gleimia hominis TaxID=595468 RepID=A0ABU3ICG1_9ACTO|nr:DNA repair protein RecN [Gleimia hominis]MDT3768062.1 DNA repair protein RecN [Gleimia hominis]
MIETIHIENLGVIKEADLDLKPGLTALTGETGAGKTMVLTSLQLLLGQRAAPGKIRAGQEQALVDGVFVIDKQAANSLELDDDEVVITRKLMSSRSRAYLNRRPVSLSVLTDLAPKVAVIHGQSEQLTLRSKSRQRALLDEFAGEKHADLLSVFHEAWAQAVAAKQAKDAFEADLANAQSEVAALSGVVEQIDALDLKPGEDERLRVETERMVNAEQIRQGIAGAAQFLQSADVSAADALGRAAGMLAKVQQYGPQLAKLVARLESASAQVSDLTADVLSALSDLDADPARLDELQNRRRTINSLLRGRAVDVTGLLEWAQWARERLHQLNTSDEHVEALTAALVQAQQKVLEVGKKLSASRARAAKTFSKLVDTELAGLSMRGAHLGVDLPKRDKPGPDGLEDVRMLLRPHAQANPVELGEGVSGGELSRIMLAIEVVMAEAQHGASNVTYVFDEIDSGVGGVAAREVGSRLARLARHRQVVVVTHLAQVAACATQHLVVEKEGATTRVRALHGQERIDEVARLLSGARGSKTARAHAAELIDAAKVAQS